MLNKPWGEIMEAFLAAYNYRPIRAEPLYHIAQIYRTKMQMPAVGFLFAKAASEIPFPTNDILFVPDAIYNYGILDELGATAHAAGFPYVGLAACRKLLQENKIPQTEIQRIKNNMQQYERIIEDFEKRKREFEISQKKPEEKVEKKKKTYKARK